MAQPGSSTKFTYEDYLLFPDDGKRHELIDGEHYVTPSPVTKHQKLSGTLFGCLFPHIQQAKIGQLLAAPMEVVLSDVDVVQPDLLYITNRRVSIMTENNIQGPPDLVVEIVSASSRKTDEMIKRKLYERHRVAEYWIVDPELESIKIYRLSDKGYSRIAELSVEADDALTSRFFPTGNFPFRNYSFSTNRS